MFQEIVSNETLIKYIDDAKLAWKEQGLPGDLPHSTIEQMRIKRFKNEFEMRFPFLEWAKRNLRIHDKVEIDMPLRLSDIKSVGTDEGI